MNDAAWRDASAEYCAGNLQSALGLLPPDETPDVASQWLKARILCDAGDAIDGLSLFDRLCDTNPVATPALRLDLEFTRLSRAAFFVSPRRAAALVSRVRPLATSLGAPASLALLHLAVATLGSLRGSLSEAKFHLDIALRLAVRHDLPEAGVLAGWASSTVDVASGCLGQARAACASALDTAHTSRHAIALPALLGYAGQLAVWTGETALATRWLDEARRTCHELPFVRLNVADALAALALREGRLDDASAHLEAARGIIASHHVPARSWHDLTHQITRCRWLNMQQHWEAIVALVNETDPEMQKRHLNTWRPTLLAARAQAEARLGRQDDADASLRRAMQACPRGAVDSMIAIETALGTCLALRGETRQAQRHFDRALRAAEAIEHRYHAWLIAAEKAALPTLAARVGGEEHRHGTADINIVAPLLSDVVSLVTDEPSVRLLAQRIVSMLECTPLRSRVDVTSSRGQGDPVTPAVSWEFRGSRGCRIALTCADGSVVIDIRSLESLEELSLVRSLTEVLASAVGSHDEANPGIWSATDPVNGEDAVFCSPRMQQLVAKVQRLADSDLPILITGETGTGKEIFARLIHQHSRMRLGPFVPFNASAIPTDLMESQMFGHRRGAFTGAAESSVGVIRSADHGTLFLDEIGDLGLAVQPKLLRFLESGEIHPVGENKPVTVKVRVIAATNAPLEELVSHGRFRSDLFYRLGVAPIALPPLRERKEEIPALTAHFLRKAITESEGKRVTVAEDAVAAMLLYDWPGNLRQLSNEIRRMVALCEDGSRLKVSDLSPEISRPWFAMRPKAAVDVGPGVTIRLDQPLEVAIEELERAFIEHALSQAHGRVTDAASLLGISRKGLFLKRKKLRLG